MKLEWICCALVAATLASCAPSVNEKESQDMETPLITSTDAVAGINLTVSESKRLIAKGIMKLPRVQERLRNGMVIITKGTTNTYIAEEMAGLEGPHGNFLTGHFVPQGKKKLNKGVDLVDEIILRNGKIVDQPYKEAVKELKAGDIIFKGANMLNYADQEAAVCIGAPDGGTTYRMLPYIGEGKAEHIIAIGLEKDSSADLERYEKELGGQNEKLTFLPKLHVFKESTIFTEIEAIKQFADVEVFPYGIGGVAGREGGISLTIAGEKSEVAKVLELVKTIQGEKPFVE